MARSRASAEVKDSRNLRSVAGQVVAGRHLGEVLDQHLFGHAAEAAVTFFAERSKFADGLVPPPGEPCPLAYQLIVPKGHLVGAGAAIAEHPQEAVALLENAAVTLQGPQVGRIGLGEENVEVASASGRGAEDQVDVLGGEEKQR